MKNAQLALGRKEASKAIDALRAATPYELGVGVGLDPIYVRSQAYLAEHEGSKTAGELQKIFEHRAITLNPIGALAHLGLARAYALQGEPSKAKVAYQDFFSLWKEADPEIPVLKEAKAEYSKLR